MSRTLRNLERANHSEKVEAALIYGGEGLHVFPCNGNKEPLVADGFYAATCDLDQIRQWWAKWPGANIGIRTGVESGVVVLDGDVKHDIDGVGAVTELLGAEATRTLQASTPSGGKHFFFDHPGEGKHVPTSAGKIAPGVDTRGDGGYIVAAPSTNGTGEPYSWDNPGAVLRPCPLEPLDGALERSDSVDIAGLPEVTVEVETAIAERGRAVEAIRNAGTGKLNITLNDQAFRLGHIVGAGGLDAQRTADALVEAAVAAGHPVPGAKRTVKSGLSSGAGTAVSATAESADVPDVSELLDAVVAFERRFVVFSHFAQAEALALWTAHTHCTQASTCTPYMWVSSPVPTSGKTRLAEVLELLVRNPIRASDASPSAIFRSIPLFQPTLLLDEVDTKFRTKGDDNAEDLRRLINSGFNRGAYVLRTEGKDRTPTKFDTYCPKMLIGIDTGAFPDTVAKRSVPIRLHRKTRSEEVERFRRRKVEGEAENLRKALAAWAEANAGALTIADPALPAELSDRQQDAWEPLLAIADAAGPQWAKRAREAAEHLHGAAEDETTEGVLLLGHIRDAFKELKTDRLLTGVLLTELIKREEGPWAIWWEQAVSKDNIKGPGSKLARMLKVFGVHPRPIRFDTGVGKGYERAQFEKVFERYFDGEEEG